MDFYNVMNFISSLNIHYDSRLTDSVSIILAFLSIVTIIYMIYNFYTFLRKTFCGDKKYEELVSVPCNSVLPKEWYEDKTEQTEVNIISDIHIAAAKVHQKFYEERCIALLQKCPEAINSAVSPCKFTPFLRACCRGNAKVVEYMLKNGADITMRTNDGATPMYLAVHNATKSQAFDSTCVNILYNAGCDVNTPKSHGYTPLHLAAKAGHVDLVCWLLAHGADPDRVTMCNKKPVVYAREHGWKKVVTLLTVRTGD